MSIEAAIHERWSMWKPLTDLIPSGSLWTGAVPYKDVNGVEIVIPYASITINEGTEITRTSSGNRIVKGMATINVWGGSREFVRDVIERMVQWFDRKDFRYSRGSVQGIFALDSTIGEADDNDDIPTWTGAQNFNFILLERP